MIYIILVHKARSRDTTVIGKTKYVKDPSVTKLTGINLIKVMCSLLCDGQD